MFQDDPDRLVGAAFYLLRSQKGKAMPIDPRMIPALEEELAWAKKNLPGGQVVRDERIAAIESELAKYRAGDAHVEPAPENLSDVSENYATSDDAAERRDEDVAKKKAKKVVEEAAVAPEPEPLETADAGVPLETTEA